ncbi:MAG: hypothetical protein JXR83_13705 [Deltaproteobacteria bacterium]|nr:hypothetical protein [Deltaproteobacteria bacterium]
MSTSMSLWQGGRAAGGVALALALLLPAVARAETEALGRARRLYGEMRYVESYGAYREALAQTGNRPADLVDIYLHLGSLAALLDREQEAGEAFLRLLCLNPDVAVPEDMPPKVRRQFGEAKARSKNTTPFKLTHTVVSRDAASGGLEVAAELEPDSLGMVSGVALRYRAAGAQSFDAVRKGGTGKLAFSVSASELPPGSAVEYFLQLEDAYGGVLWESGSERSPLLAQASAAAPVSQPTAAEEPPFYTQTWFFLAAGAAVVVAVAGVSTAAVVLSQPAAKLPTLDPIDAR